MNTDVATEQLKRPTKPELSVIVPVYNVEDYLNLCLDSLTNQTFANIEIVCVNDGTLDNSRNILAARQENDARIKIIDKQNEGLSSARNAGINASSAPYVCFLDADDRFAPNACARIIEAFEESNADVVTFGGYCYPESAATPWITAKLSPRDITYEGFDPKLIFEEQSTPYIRTACRKEFLNEHNIRFDESLPFGEDQVFFFDIYPNSEKTVLISDKLYEYRISREGSLTEQTNDDLESRCRKHLPMLDRIFSAWKARFGTSCFTAEIVSWSIEFVLYGILCLPSQTRNELLREYATIFAKFYGEDSFEKLPLSKQDLKIIRAALVGKPVGNMHAKQLRFSWFVNKYGFKTIVGKILGMN